jgi:triacylglycerol lipase
MIARLQQALVFAVLVASAAWIGWSVERGMAASWLLAGLLVLLLPHAWLLAVEFVLLALFGRDPAVPRASAAVLIRAWWQEVGTATRVFGWRQPFAEHREADVPGRPGCRGVVLVHGFVCNRGLWARWLRRLRAEGVPASAITLEPVFGPIDALVLLLDAAVARMQRQTGEAPLIVAHSMGGLVVRAWLREHGADARVCGTITLGTPHHGTWMAQFALAANGRQMRRHSRWLTALGQGEPASRRAGFTCFYSACDAIVFPAASATLDGADNRLLGGCAHLSMVEHPEVFDEAMRRLRRPSPLPSSRSQ